VDALVELAAVGRNNGIKFGLEFEHFAGGYFNI